MILTSPPIAILPPPAPSPSASVSGRGVVTTETASREVNLSACVSDHTARGRPPSPMIGADLVSAMQWVFFVALILRWIFWR